MLMRMSGASFSCSNQVLTFSGADVLAAGRAVVLAGNVTISVAESTQTDEKSKRMCLVPRG